MSVDKEGLRLQHWGANHGREAGHGVRSPGASRSAWELIPRYEAEGRDAARLIAASDVLARVTPMRVVFA